jgi:hypothetical protein
MRPMTRLGFLRYLYLLLLLSFAPIGDGLAQETPDFAGVWVLRLGNRPFIVVTLTPVPGSKGEFTGSLARPKHFSTGDGQSFSKIQGPTVAYPVVRTSLKENCLALTDDFQLCSSGQGRVALKITAAPFEPSPVTKEKEPLAVFTDWDNTRTYSLYDNYVPNVEMQQIFEEDQKDRAGKINWGIVGKADAARRTATRTLLAMGNLHTGLDFERAAFVFQHGDTPDDYLLAHTLAMVAVARGQSSAIWIASATMDRYLNSIHQPQIYGTQFYTKPNEPATQEPYNRGLVSDALRRELGVPSQAAQEEQRKKYDAEQSHP